MTQGDECRSPESAKRAERAEPNLLSLAIFVAGLFGVLLIPVKYNRRAGPDDE